MLGGLVPDLYGRCRIRRVEATAAAPETHARNMRLSPPSRLSSTDLNSMDLILEFHQISLERQPVRPAAESGS